MKRREDPVSLAASLIEHVSSRRVREGTMRGRLKCGAVALQEEYYAKGVSLTGLNYTNGETPPASAMARLLPNIVGGRRGVFMVFKQSTIDKLLALVPKTFVNVQDATIKRMCHQFQPNDSSFAAAGFTLVFDKQGIPVFGASTEMCHPGAFEKAVRFVKKNPEIPEHAAIREILNESVYCDFKSRELVLDMFHGDWTVGCIGNRLD